MSTEGVLKLLIDTNVWMDYFSGRSDRTANVAHLIEIADASERIALLPRRFRSKTFHILSRRQSSRSAEERLAH